MAVTFWIPAVTFEWPSPAATAPEVQAPAPTPAATSATKPPRKRAAPKRSRKRKRAEGRLSPQMRATIDDRLEAALCDGRVHLIDEDMPCEGLDFTLNELEYLVRVLLPDEADEAVIELRERLKRRVKR